MKFVPPRTPLSPARARNCALLNQCATPGLGSLFARRFVAGAGQLTLAVTGFLLFCAWFFDVMRQYYGMITDEADPHFHHWLALAGIGVFALAWLWALVTSISLLREAKRNARQENVLAAPPVLPRT